MANLQVAIIGAGGHAQSHFAMIKNEAEMDLVAVADIDERRLAHTSDEHGVTSLFTDYREMLEKIDLDVVYVETFPGPLAGIVIDCLEAGLHTSVEKPPGVTSVDTRRMLEAEKKSSAKAIVSLNRRYFPKVLAIRKMLQDRGGAVHVAATYNKPQMGEKIRETGHLISLDAIHHVDLLRWLAGDVAEVYAEAWSAPSHPTEMRHNAVIRFKNDCRGVMMSHYAVGYRIQRFEAHAEGLSAYVDMTRGQNCEIYVDGEPFEDELDLDAVGGPDFNETRHFVECIQNDTQPWSTLEDAVKTMQLCEAIEAGHKGPLAS